MRLSTDFAYVGKEIGMKKRLVKIISIILTVSILLTSLNLTVFAAELYIKDIKVFIAGSSSQAKEYCAQEGYTLLDYDVNQDTGKDFVYIGYQTTTDPAEAITDIKVMNMGGGYIVKDGGAMMEQMQADLLADATYFMTIVEEFRANYHAGSEAAQSAVNMMNICYMDDGESLGDFILNTANAQNMVDVLFYADPQHTIFVKTCLSMGLGYLGKLDWLERTKMVMQSDMSFRGDYKEPDLTDESSAEATETEPVALPIIAPEPYTYTDEEIERAYDIYDQTIAFQERYQEWLAQKIERENSGVVQTEVEMLLDYFSFYFSCLEAFEITDGVKMSDYLLNENITVEDVYPIAAAITEGETVMLNFVGILAFSNTMGFEAKNFSNLMSIVNATEPFSFWENNSRVDYNGLIAFTTEASQEMSLNPHDYQTGFDFAMAGRALGGSALIAVLSIIGLNIESRAYPALVAEEAVAMRYASSVAYSWNAAKAEAGEAAYTAANASRVASANTIKTFSRLARGAIIVMIILAAVMASFALYEHFKTPEIDERPDVIFSVVEDLDTGKNTYLQYKVVRDQNGSAGNINGSGIWTSLYITKDPRAGKPITANLIAQTSQATPDGYANVSKFGREAAIDLNGMIKGSQTHFLFFKPSATSYFPASIFGDNGMMFLIGGGGLIVGIVVGGLVTGMNKKRKSVLKNI